MSDAGVVGVWDEVTEGVDLSRLEMYLADHEEAIEWVRRTWLRVVDPRLDVGEPVSRARGLLDLHVLAEIHGEVLAALFGDLREADSAARFLAIAPISDLVLGFLAGERGFPPVAETPQERSALWEAIAFARAREVLALHRDHLEAQVPVIVGTAVWTHHGSLRASRTLSRWG